jgi:hypothetical protein
MTSKFETLIEYVINDEEDKAKELFHDIVVEKSREIYENLMSEEEELDEESDAERDDHAEKAGKKVAKDIEYDEMHEDMGGDASDDLIRDVETEEQGMMEEGDEESDVEFDDAAEEDGEDLTHDMEKDHDDGADIEDRVVDLEDKLDELMAEFEAIMGSEDHDDNDDLEPGEGGDALAQDDTMEFEPDSQMMENVKLDAAPKPVTTEPAGTGTKSTVAFNSGAKGMQGSPVKSTGDVAQGRSTPKSGDLPEAGQFKNVPGKGTANSKQSAAPKPTTAQAAGVNTRSPVSKA